MSALDEVEWIPRTNSPVETAVLAGDPATGAHVRLVKLPAGFVVPDHAHHGRLSRCEPDRDVEAHLPGNRRKAANCRRVPSSSSPAAKCSGDACIGPEDCIIMLSQSVAADFILPPNDEVTVDSHGMDGAARWTTP